MGSPTISIIIPVFNVEKYLRHCLDSALDQTYKNFEIVCVNDGSTDSSLDILNEYASEHKNIHVIDQENKGLSSARNAGINKANGNYILFLDSDDWIEENTLGVLVDNTGLGNIDMLCFKGRLYHESENRFEIEADFEEGILSGWDYFNKYSHIMRKFHFVSVVLRLYRREFLLTNQLFFKEGLFHEDNLFTPIVCYYAQNVKVINTTFYNYRIRGGSITQSKNFKRITDIIIIINELSAFFIPITGIQKKNLYRMLASAYIGLYLKTFNDNYHNQIKEVNRLVNFRSFRKVSISFRHRLLFTLIYIHPLCLHFYNKFVNFIR